MSQDFAPILPPKVYVTFRGRTCSNEADDAVLDQFPVEIALSDLTLTDSDAVAPDSTASYPGRWKIFHDTALAINAAPDTTPDNNDALQALAQQIAQDYYDWLTIGFDTAYSGIVAPEPTGLHDLIEWCYEPERVSTRIRSAPLNGDPEELCHQDPDGVAGCQDLANAAPGIVYFGPPAECSHGGAAATCTIAGGRVVSISLTAQGCGYTSAPKVQFALNADGVGAKATATIDGGKVTGVSVTDGGSGYTRAPIVSFKGGAAKPSITRYVFYLEDGRLRKVFISTDCLNPAC